MRVLPWARLSAMLGRGECEPLLCICGDSEFLIERAARAVAGLVRQEDRALCLWSGPAGDAEPDRLLDDASTLPMGGERRVLLIREAEKFPILEHVGWRAYLRRPSLRAVVVWIAGAGADTKSLRALKEACAVTELDAPRARALPAWLCGEAKELGRTLSPREAAWMVELCGPGLAALRAWLERAALYREGAQGLSREDLEAVSGRRAPADLFAWSDRIGEGNAAAALQVAQRAVEDGEEALSLLGRAANHLRRLAALRDGLDRGVAPARAAEGAGIHAFVAPKMIAQARARSREDLGRALGGCAAADRMLKSVRVSPARVLDSFILAARKRS